MEPRIQDLITECEGNSVKYTRCKICLYMCQRIDMEHNDAHKWFFDMGGKWVTMTTNPSVSIDLVTDCRDMKHWSDHYKYKHPLEWECLNV